MKNIPVCTYVWEIFIKFAVQHIERRGILTRTYVLYVHFILNIDNLLNKFIFFSITFYTKKNSSALPSCENKIL